ncbi:hypothetical protein HBI56_202180 [Parastagonospora nodorum]|uniref:NmrA-like domain-containing protein n=2 Tax=Phaeosphaeria nodorum (strain SN15 / ATCC MYA-4574 / FGSC 10173) TaxID=321614 RepID=A0A7U2HW05_PHANO|nr:hypothetical protein SNOG_20176 [Parastagonospora nodorum SN15]KAH3905682.1 hypothetical protein HBH56_216710 [Parastagonospora nodorum]EDP89873.1 hypothetical protein SNOG_20176 [Parastagonospora nodorum SN15]KAH3922701.1 hypothetical protein HBH54_220820 [Parastagonospora nodorum]KAH3942202.1 hypothetical protein HBH53_190740 [Parastagonospora nodorum]KAH3961289.1 hypothetical protein HBH51_185380 [Parastagonospora nodorum]
MASYKNVILIGASSDIGTAILNTFINESSFNTTVLTREGSSSTFPAGVKVIRANYDSADALKDAFKGQDVAVSLVGGTGFGEQNKLIDAAIAAGVQRFVPSEFGSDTADARVRELVPILEGKFATANYLKSKESVISWTILANGPFFEWCFKVGYYGFNLADKTVTLYDDGTAIFSTTNLHTVGLGLVKALEKPEETKNQYVYISSFDTSQNELLALTEKITGSKWTVKHVAVKDHVEQGRAKLQKGDFSGIVELLQATSFSKDQLGRFDQAPAWNEKLGLPKDDLEKSLRGVFEG